MHHMLSPARILVGCLLAVCALDPAWGHHSVGAFFDRTTMRELEGTLTAVQWRNPHTGLVIAIDTAQGNQQEWLLAAAAVNAVERRGLARESLHLGDHIRVAGWQSRRGLQEMYITNILLPDGREFMVSGVPQALRWTERGNGPATVGTAPAGVDNDGVGIFRVWSVIDLYRQRGRFSYTPAAQAARGAWNPLTDDPSLLCIPPGMANAILNPYPIEFVDEGDRIRLRIEEWQQERVIHMSAVASPDSQAPSPLGYSVGSWENGALLVETTRINWPYLDGDGTPQSENVHILERFSLSADERRLDYQVVVSDPENVIEAAVWDADWRAIPGRRIRPFECNPN